MNVWWNQWEHGEYGPDISQNREVETWGSLMECWEEVDVGSFWPLKSECKTDSGVGLSGPLPLPEAQLFHTHLPVGTCEGGTTREGQT